MRAKIRVDKRTKDLTKRLHEGEIAVINHKDIDRVAAEALVAKKPYAVLNAAQSTSGRYPNSGPSIILNAGIHLVDNLGDKIMKLRENSYVTIEEGDIYADGKHVATGIMQTIELNKKDLEAAREDLGEQIEAFAQNTLEYMRREKSLLLDGVGVPRVNTVFEGRHTLIVVRGYHYKEDLDSLKPYIREYRPILVGVDGGADAILEEGLVPDMIIGDMDSVTDKALRCGAEIVVHAYRDGNAPGTERLDELGVDYVTFPAVGTSEDIAMLMADDKGAELIVALGTHATLVEFLDKGRAGMASTFLTRLRVGGRLVDAKGVSQLYRARVSTTQAFMFVLVGITAVMVALSVTPVGNALFGLFHIYFNDFLDFWRNLFGLSPGTPTR
ncbi:MAG: putative cytokinetic ring protein SteA [Actinomycetaceae bacterium]|nr:putative cytokinetic ring protein SteA [Actinomycetaceae bacterium]